MESAWATVVVNHGAAGGQSEASSRLTLIVRTVPDGIEGKVMAQARNHQSALITHGMHVPVLIDPRTREPRALMAEHLDEAIGRYFQQLEPGRHATWQEALDARKRDFRRDQFVPSLGLGDVRGAVQDLPGGLRSFFRELRKIPGELRGGTHNRYFAHVLAIEPTGETQDGQTVYAITLKVMDLPTGRKVDHRQALSEARAAQLASTGYAEVTLDATDPDRLTL
jgi:hypothetical protein